MNQKINPKILMLAAYGGLVLVLGLLGYWGVSDRLKTNPIATSPATLASASAVPELTGCSGLAQPWCIVSTGFDGGNNLLISLKTTTSPVPTVQVIATSNGQEVVFACRDVDSSPGMVYCLGRYTVVEATLSLQVRRLSDGAMLAAGELMGNGKLAVASAATPMQLGLTDVTVTPSPEPTREESYPSYPSSLTYP